MNKHFVILTGKMNSTIILRKSHIDGWRLKAGIDIHAKDTELLIYLNSNTLSYIELNNNDYWDVIDVMKQLEQQLLLNCDEKIFG